MIQVCMVLGASPMITEYSVSCRYLYLYLDYIILYLDVDCLRNVGACCRPIGPEVKREREMSRVFQWKRLDAI